MLIKIVTCLLVIGTRTRSKRNFFECCPFRTAFVSAVVTGQIARGVPSHIYQGWNVFEIRRCVWVKFGRYRVVPVAFTAAVTFGLHAVRAVGVWFTTTDTLPYLLHGITKQDLLDGVVIEIAQHVGITCAAGLDITAWIDVQATPRGRTVKIVHAVI